MRTFFLEIFPDTKIIDSVPVVFIIFRNLFLPKKEVMLKLDPPAYIRRLVIVYATMATDGKAAKA